MRTIALAPGALPIASCISGRAIGPFLEQVDNQTWIIGNEIWNLTQEVTYGVKLYYQDHDCVGDAVGHYVSYSTSQDLTLSTQDLSGLCKSTC